MKIRKRSFVVGALLLTAALLPGFRFARNSQSNDTTPQSNKSYWQVVEGKTHSDYGSSSYGPSCMDSFTQREYDEYGNVIKEITQRVTREGEAYSDEYQEITDDVVNRNISNFEGDIYASKVITEYTYDKDHWPVSKSEKQLLPQSEWVGGKETYSKPEVTEFTFERDGKGRLVRTVVPSMYRSYSRGVEYTMTTEFTYYKSGELKSAKSVGKHEEFDSATGDAAVVEQENVREYRKDGKLSKQTITIKDKSGSILSRSESTYDDKSSDLNEVVTRPQNNGKDLVTRCEYENKYKNDELTSQVKWVYGDGVTENREHSGTDAYAVTALPDGSISATKISSEYDRATRKTVEVRGETKTYEGPYSSRKIDLNADGTVKKSVEVMFDGTESITDYTRDVHGLPTKTHAYTNTDSGRKNDIRSEFQYAPIKNPSDFVRAFDELTLDSYVFDFASSYEVLD